MSAVKEAASQQSQAEQPAWDWPHRVPSQPAQRMLDVHAIRVLEQSHLDFREDFQNLALRRLADHAASRSVWWREWIGMPPHRLSVQTLARLPILARTDFRAAIEHAGGALPLPGWQGETLTNSTSGSSGVPVAFHVSQLANRVVDSHYYADHQRHGRNLRLKLAALLTRFEQHPGKPHITLPAQPWQGVGEIAARQSMGRSMREHAQWLHDVNPVYLNTSPVMVAGLVQACEEGVPPATALKQIMTVGETVTPEMREGVRHFFGAEIKDRYTCEEIGPIAFQCPHDLRLEPDYHVCVSNNVVEVVDDEGRACAEGQPGRVLVTGLHHWASPAIRYDLGDIASMKQQCSCGARIPTLFNLLGRKRFLIRLPSGERLLLKLVAKDWLSVAPIREHRVTQVTQTQLKVELVLDRQLTADEHVAIREMLHQQVSPLFSYEVLQVESIAWTRSAKRQDVLSLV